MNAPSRAFGGLGTGELLGLASKLSRVVEYGEGNTDDVARAYAADLLEPVHSELAARDGAEVLGGDRQ